MSLFVTLTSAESKRLIARAAARMPLVTERLGEGRKLLISQGSTAGYVLEELLGEKLDLKKTPCGCIAFGRTCRTPADRIGAVLLAGGKRAVWPEEEKRRLAEETAASLGPEDLLIKGANAIDPAGFAGFLLGDAAGGLLMAFWRSHTVRKCPILIPVGLEKLIASVPEAERAMRGRDGYERSIGRGCGYAVVGDGVIVTEIEAIRLLSGCRATHVASGGIGLSAGSVVLSVEGEETRLDELFRLLKTIKGEPPLQEWKMDCTGCEKHCGLPMSMNSGIIG